MTTILEEMTAELEEAEQILEKSLVPFLRVMFCRFYEHRTIFSNAASCVGELDCLCALADVSADSSNGVMCKPEVLPRPVDGKQILELKKMRHPCVQMVMKDSASRKFIPNDVTLSEPHTLLITGPNMGGKSTFLR